MITGMELLSFISNRPWAMKFLTQQEYKMLIRITGLVLLFIGILYAIQIMQFEAMKRQISSGHDSANNPRREQITETNTELLSTTLGNFSTDVLTNTIGNYTTDRSWSPYPRGEAGMTTKRNSSYTPASLIRIAENDVGTAKPDKARNNCRMESDNNISCTPSTDGNYTSQMGWLPDQDTNASAATSLEGHTNNTVAMWIPVSDISTPITAKDYINSSTIADMLPSADSIVLSATSVKDSSNCCTIETNSFPSPDLNMFTALTPKNNSNLSQTNWFLPLDYNISAAIITENYFNVSDRNWLPIQGRNISVDTTTNHSSNEKYVHSIVPLSSKAISKNFTSNFNKNYAFQFVLFATCLLLFCLNHI